MQSFSLLTHPCVIVSIPDSLNPPGQADGITIEAAGLRGLPQLFLVEIERATGKKIAAVSPQEVLHGGDVLWFAGVLESVASLRKIPGKGPVKLFMRCHINIIDAHIH